MLGALSQMYSKDQEQKAQQKKLKNLNIEQETTMCKFRVKGHMAAEEISKIKMELSTL